MIIFDQDGTLYPRGSALFRQMSLMGRQWVAQRLGLDDEGVELLYQRLRSEYPNPIEGFNSVGLTAEDYHSSVFDRLPVEALLESDAAVGELIRALDGPVYVVTMSSARFSDRVLETLGLRHLIAGRFCFPDPETGSHQKVVVYERLRLLHGLQPAQVTVVGDNFELDLADASVLGYRCILIADAGPPGVLTIPNIHSLKAQISA